MTGSRRSRATILAAVVALLGLIQMPALSLGHGLGEDDVCTANLGSHDSAAHGMRAAKSAPAPHCALCHWWQFAGRYNGSTFPSTTVLIVDLGLVAGAPVAAHGLTDTLVGSVRAPPAL